MWSSVGGGSGRVSDPTDVWASQPVQFPNPAMGFMWRDVKTGYWREVRNYGDAVDMMRGDRDYENMPHWWSPNSDFGTPSGYTWSKNSGDWTLVRDSSGSSVSVSGGRDVTDTFRDRWRRRHAGYSRLFFSR